MICGYFSLAKALRRKKEFRAGGMLPYLLGVILWLSACQREALTPEISLDGATQCKEFHLKSGDTVAKNLDCIRYSWSDNTLAIKHMNAGFNCCPEEFYVDLKVSGDTLIITEREKSNMCDCNCLYDLDYTLTGIRKGVWWIRVKEPYAQAPNEELIVFEVDFAEVTEGRVCFERTGYPWR